MARLVTNRCALTARWCVCVCVSLQKFLSSEFSDENINFWKEVERYKSLHRPEQVCTTQGVQSSSLLSRVGSVVGFYRQ